jgi:hypothetical protein
MPVEECGWQGMRLDMHLKRRHALEKSDERYRELKLEGTKRRVGSLKHVSQKVEDRQEESEPPVVELPTKRRRVAEEEYRQWNENISMSQSRKKRYLDDKDKEEERHSSKDKAPE